MHTQHFPIQQRLIKRTNYLIHLISKSDSKSKSNSISDSNSISTPHIGWLTNEIHDVMYKWATLFTHSNSNTYSNTNTNTNTNQIENNKTHLTAIQMNESLLKAVLNHDQNNHNHDQNHVVHPTAQMFARTIQTLLKSNANSNTNTNTNSTSTNSNHYHDHSYFNNNNNNNNHNDLQKAKTYLHRLFHLLQTNQLFNPSHTNNHIDIDQNEDAHFLHQSFALVTHELLKQARHQSYKHGNDNSLQIQTTNNHNDIHKTQSIAEIRDIVQIMNSFFSTPILKTNIPTSKYTNTLKYTSAPTPTSTSTSTNRYPKIAPTTTSLNAIIHMLVITGDPLDLQQAHALVHSMLQQSQNIPKSNHNSNSDSKLPLNLKPNVVTFNLLIHGYARSGNAKAAEEILTWMHTLHEQGHIPITSKPDLSTYNVVLHAYAKAAANAYSDNTTTNTTSHHRHHHDAHIHAIHAERLFNKMESITQNSKQTHDHDHDGQWNYDLTPDKMSYTALISAHAKSGNAKRAHTIFNSMLSSLRENNCPDHVTLSALVDAYAKSRDTNAVQHCWNIIHLMENLAGIDHYHPNRTDHNNTPHSQPLQSHPQSHPLDIHVGPSTITFNSLIQAIGNQKLTTESDNIVQDALNVLDYIKARNCQPNIFTYNIIISILGKNKQTDKARNFFNHVKHDPLVHINRITYNTFLDALAKGNEENSAEEALSILSEMKESNTSKSSNTSDLTPNTRTYNTAMNVLSKNGNEWCHHVETLLSEMERLFEEKYKINQEDHHINMNSCIIPNTVSYTTYINAIARSSMKRKAKKAGDVLIRMDSARAKGNKLAVANTQTYNTILNACHFIEWGSNEKKEAVNVALNVMDKMRSENHARCKPSDVTYGALMKVLCRHARDRSDIIMKELQRCCEDGLFSSFVMRQVKTLIPRQEYKDLLKDLILKNGSNVGNNHEIPPYWHRNVPERKKP